MLWGSSHLYIAPLILLWYGSECTVDEFQHKPTVGWVVAMVNQEST